MLRGYRSIILAFVGWLILANAGAAPPHKTAPATQAERNQAPPAQQRPSAAPEPKYAPYPDRQAERCYEAQNHDSADLCAQWRAAYAAEKAAGAAVWGAIIAGFGALLSFVGLLLVLRALSQGREANRLNMKEASRNTLRAVAAAEESRKALEIADRSAAAAVASVEATQETTRPWLSLVLDEIESLEVRDGGVSIKASVTVTNIGVAPAIGVMILPTVTAIPEGAERITVGAARVKLRKTFEGIRANAGSMGLTAFPQKPLEQTTNFALSQKELRESGVGDGKRPFLLVAVGVTYTYLGRVRETVNEYFIWEKAGDNMALDMHDRVLTGAELQVRDSMGGGAT